jgi:hypothetical protein
MLVIWICCCLLHRVALQAHPGLLPNYGLPMRFDELKHCVLDDKLAIDAALAVATYVREWTRTANQTLFSLRDRVERDTTIKFARSFAERNRAMRLRLQLEKDLAKRRQEEGWERVSGKKEQAIRKRLEIKNTEAKISELNAKLLDFKIDLEERKHGSWRPNYDHDLKEVHTKKNKVIS